ncbi:MAG: glycosyltransferase family 9 protein [Chloroflexi bacterium]|nr:glycosyltransferase family 9 protein [Chloroflexota bacterium]
MNQPWQYIRNLVVARLDSVGDVVMLSPALRAIKENLPGVRVTLLASPAGAAAAEMLPEVDDVIAWRAVWQDVEDRLPLDADRELQLVRALREKKFDAAFIFTSFSQTPYGAAYACYLAGIPVRLGQSKELGGGLLSRAVPPPDDAVHQAERNLHLLESAGFAIRSRDLRLRIPKTVGAAAMRKLAQKGLDPGRPHILLDPGVSCPARAYSPNRFGAVADILARETGVPVVLAGAEGDQRHTEAVAAAMRTGPIVLASETSVPEWAVLVRGARLLLSAHTSSMHLAEAFRTPSVVLFSGTDLVSQWAPRRLPSRILQRPVSCSPCYASTCARDDMRCLEFSTHEVVTAALEVLSETATPEAEGIPTGYDLAA